MTGSINGDDDWDESASRAANLTRLLRESDAALFQGLREKLAALDLLPREVVLADLWPDDPACEFGIVVCSPARVYTFDYYYGAEGDLWAQYRNGVVVNLADITAEWAGGAYAASVNDGLA